MKSADVQPTAPRRGLLITFVVLGTGLLALGILPRLHQNSELTMGVAQAKEEGSHPMVEVVALDAPRPVPSAAPGAVPIPPPDNSLRLPATVQAIEQTILNARATGYLRRRYVDIGSHVKAGQLLAEIESPDTDHELSQAQAQVVKSQATVRQASADVLRLQANVAQTQAEVTRSLAQEQQAQAALDHADARLLQSRTAVAQAKAKKASALQVLEGKKADLTRVKAQATLDARNWERYQTLVNDGAVAQETADEKKNAAETSQATVTATEAAIRSAEADVEAADTQIQSAVADVQAAQTDITSARQALQAARSQVASSEANLSATRASVGAGRSGQQAAQAQVNADAANVRRFAVLRSFEKMTAPFDGVITTRNADAGALINAGSPTGLFGLARTDTLRVLVNVPQANVATLRPGQKVEITVRERPGQTFVGTLFSTAGALDPTTRTLLADIRLPNRDNAVLPGMYAEVKFPTTGESVHSVRIPANTLIVNAQGTQVASVGPDSVVHLLPVTLGRDYGTDIDILNGLTGHERLVVNPTDAIQDGMTVKVVTPAPTAATAGKTR